MKNLGTIKHCFLCPWKEYRATTGIAFCDNPNGDKFDITDKYLDCGINPKCPLADKHEPKPERVSAEEILANLCGVTEAGIRMWPESQTSVAIALKAMEEYANQSLSLPSDEEIDKQFPCVGNTPSMDNVINYSKQYGAKWVISEIFKNNGQADH